MVKIELILNMDLDLDFGPDLELDNIKIKIYFHLQSASDVIVSNFLVDRSDQVCRRPLIVLISARKTLSK